LATDVAAPADGAGASPHPLLPDRGPFVTCTALQSRADPIAATCVALPLPGARRGFSANARAGSAAGSA
jgi:hypothetical protein